VHAQSGSFDVEKAIAAGDHKGLAEYYQSQAEAQRKIAAMHDKMKTAYRNTHVHYKGIENVLAGHCGDLKFEALKMAEQYDALAKQEEKLAQGK
jgi:7-cyano-7-deazaguanine synthase in queuosine biosynthesis